MSAPTDIELMMFADGELTGDRREEVASYLEKSKDARLKLKAMDIVGELVRKDADRLATAYRADDIVGRVLAKVDADAAPSSEEKTATLEKRTSPTTRDAFVPKSAPANDNGRFIYTSRRSNGEERRRGRARSDGRSGELGREQAWRRLLRAEGQRWHDDHDGGLARSSIISGCMRGLDPTHRVSGREAEDWK
jgi:hypothetical protein